MESTVSIMSDLNTPWFSVWRSAAMSTSAWRFGRSPAKIMARERHMVTRAMFSILE